MTQDQRRPPLTLHGVKLQRQRRWWQLPLLRQVPALATPAGSNGGRGSNMGCMARQQRGQTHLP